MFVYEGSSRSKTLKTFIVISLLANVILAISLFGFYFQNIQYRDQIKVLSDQNKELGNEVVSLRQAIDLEREQLTYYKNQAEYYSRISKQSLVGKSLTGFSRINLVAVRTVSSSLMTSSYEGVVLSSEIELHEGEGRRLVNTEPEIGIDMQTSLRIAVSVAETVTRLSLNTTDVILTIRSSEKVEVVDGPSAGAAVTLAVILAIQNRTIDTDVYITGTINADGSIGKVGGVLEKAIAASDMGARLFLIPSGQSILQGYKPVKTEPIPGFTIITYEPYQIDLQEELVKNGSTTTVIEVQSIKDVLDILEIR
ncbi:S16 family serine protease [[Eubacterium] cellulosolvens]